jgi:hypothetical protein
MSSMVRLSVVAADEDARQYGDAESSRAVPRGAASNVHPEALNLRKPGQAGEAEQSGDEEVQPEAEEVVGGVDP